MVFNAVKGLITDDHHIPAATSTRCSGVPYDRIGLISGPSHAEEVARKNWTYLTLACPDEPWPNGWPDRVSNQWLRTETTDDLFGIELAAVLKNVYAVAAGIAHGLGLGDNFIAVMMSNALQGNPRFLDAINETAPDVNASAYMGDFIVTAYSPHSRNRRLGTMMGRGYRARRPHRNGHGRRRVPRRQGHPRDQPEVRGAHARGRMRIPRVARQHRPGHRDAHPRGQHPLRFCPEPATNPFPNLLVLMVRVLTTICS